MIHIQSFTIANVAVLKCVNKHNSPKQTADRNLLAVLNCDW